MNLFPIRQLALYADLAHVVLLPVSSDVQLCCHLSQPLFWYEHTLALTLRIILPHTPFHNDLQTLSVAVPFRAKHHTPSYSLHIDQL